MKRRREKERFVFSKVQKTKKETNHFIFSGCGSISLRVRCFFPSIRRVFFFMLYAVLSSIRSFLYITHGKIHYTRL